jgi:hypothetical protein
VLSALVVSSFAFFVFSASPLLPFVRCIVYVVRFVSPPRLHSTFSLIPPTTTIRLPLVGYGGSSWNQMIPPDPTKIPLHPTISHYPTRSHQIPPDPTKTMRLGI